ncbi:SDR family oxidoreductase, partial [Staphylococcus haemolyticus]
PSPILHDYAASKAAIISLTKSFSEELGAKGIRVNCVAPGPFWSPLQITGGQPQSAIPTFGQQTPLGRAGQPVELSG